MFILSWLAKIGIGTIATKLASAYEAKQNATTKRQEIAATERIKRLEAKRDVLNAEAGHRAGAILNAGMRAFLSLPVGILLWKVLVYDKALGQWTAGSTDALSPQLWQVVTAVVSFYLVAEVGIAWAKRKR